MNIPLRRKILAALLEGPMSNQDLALKCGVDVEAARSSMNSLMRYGCVQSRPMTYGLTEEGVAKAIKPPKVKAPVKKMSDTNTRKVLLAYLDAETPADYEHIQEMTTFDPRVICRIANRLSSRGLLKRVTKINERPTLMKITHEGRLLAACEKESGVLSADATVALAIRSQPSSVFAMGAM